MKQRKNKRNSVQPISVFILGEHALVRQGLAFTLGSVFKIVGQSEFNKHSMQTLTQKKPKIILLDILVFDSLIAETIVSLNILSGHSRVIVLCPDITPAVHLEMISLKVAGILTKNVSIMELKQAIHTIVNYNFIVCSGSTVQPTVNNSLSHLSPQILSRYETELIKLISSGMTSKDISKRLNISFSTVGNHRYNLMKKLDVRNTAELVRFASTNAIAMKDND
jgi:DNA-binding NarL/FixJ family response regulator